MGLIQNSPPKVSENAIIKNSSQKCLRKCYNSKFNSQKVSGNAITLVLYFILIK